MAEEEQPVLPQEPENLPGSTEEAPAEVVETTQPETNPMPSGSRWHKFKKWYGAHKKWTIPLTALIAILILAVIPWTRYNLAGLVIKHDISVKVLDSETKTPVSGADVNIGSLSAQTDAQGTAVLHKIKAGHMV